MANDKLTRRELVYGSVLAAAGGHWACRATKMVYAANPTKEGIPMEAAAPPKARVLSRIDIRDFGAETVRIGDLDGDGGPAGGGKCSATQRSRRAISSAVGRAAQLVAPTRPHPADAIRRAATKRKASMGLLLLSRGPCS